MIFKNRKSVKKSSKKKNSRGLSRFSALRNTKAIAFVLVFAAIGGYILFHSYAATSNYVKVNFAPVGILGGDGDTGYWLVAKDGGVFTQGTATFHGSVGGQGITNIIGMAGPANHSGYWLAGSDGGIFTEFPGGQPFYNSLPGEHVSVNDICCIAARPQGDGYWLAGKDGGVFAFGNAPYDGNQVGGILAYIVGMASSGSGNGYWLVNSVGQVYQHGDAGFYGDERSAHLAAPIVGMAKTPNGQGYWLVGADGGVFAFGNAGYYGSMAGTPLTGAIVGITPTDDGQGYWLAGADGGVFAFGDAQFEGRVVYTPPTPSPSPSPSPSPAPSSPGKSSGGGTSSGSGSSSSSGGGGSSGSSSSGSGSGSGGSSNSSSNNISCDAGTFIKPNLTKGDTGSCVALLNADLFYAGVTKTLSTDDTYTQATQAAVWVAQSNCGISSTEVVGINTWNCLQKLDNIISPNNPNDVVSSKGEEFTVFKGTPLPQNATPVQAALLKSGALNSLPHGSLYIIDCYSNVVILKNGTVDVSNAYCAQGI